MEFDWVRTFLEQEARYFPKAAGYYNHNYVVKHNNVNYLIRVPIPNRELMDLSIIPEKQNFTIFRSLQISGTPFAFCSEDNSFSVHSFIEGTVLDTFYPDNAPFPDWIARDLARQIYLLHSLPAASFEPYCNYLAISPDTPQFFLALVNHVRVFMNASVLSMGTCLSGC